MSATPQSDTAVDAAGIGTAQVETAGKRGRKASPPDPGEGPVAAFAHELWLLKQRAGDPSFAAMCQQLGAAASKSSLAAATRGAALPSWETTWEFVRVLAVGVLGEDEAAVHRVWLARWTAASAPPAPAVPDAAVTPGDHAVTPAHAAVTPDAAVTPVDAVAPGTVAGVVPVPPGESPATTVLPRPARSFRRFRSSRRQLVAAATLATGMVAGVGTLAAALPTTPPQEQPGAPRPDDAAFEGDVTVPDGTVVATGERFTKVWQLRNTGSARWEGRYLTRMNNTDCHAPGRVPIPVTEPGAAVRIPVPVTASDSPAQCKIYWKMTDATNRLLLPGKDPIYLDVTVRDAR